MRAFAAYLYGRSLATEITFGYHASEFLRFLRVDGLKAGNSVSSNPTRVGLFVCPEFLVQTFNEASVVFQKANEGRGAECCRLPRRALRQAFAIVCSANLFSLWIFSSSLSRLKSADEIVAGTSGL